jgi:hypothetical protein
VELGQWEESDGSRQAIEFVRRSFTGDALIPDGRL